jgi:hypothetical protein
MYMYDIVYLKSYIQNPLKNKTMETKQMSPISGISFKPTVITFINIAFFGLLVGVIDSTWGNSGVNFFSECRSMFSLSYIDNADGVGGLIIVKMLFLMFLATFLAIPGAIVSIVVCGIISLFFKGRSAYHNSELVVLGCEIVFLLLVFFVF